jgi:hypothetical protein
MYTYVYHTGSSLIRSVEHQEPVETETLSQKCNRCTFATVLCAPAGRFLCPLFVRSNHVETTRIHAIAFDNLV